jgi:hypothetical protein
MCYAAIDYNLRQICCLQMYRVHGYIVLYMANKKIICGTCKYDQKDLCMRGIYVLCIRYGYCLFEGLNAKTL